MKVVCLAISLCILSLAAAAQTTGKIAVNEPPIITEMMRAYEAANRIGNMTGWRVQILATTNRQQLDSERQSFQYNYPNIPINWVHNRPYYKLRAGAFRTRIEAERLKYVLGRDYDGLYLVRDDNIQPREFLLRY